MSEQSPLVVVGVDGSRESVDALTWAMRYTRSTGGTIRAVIAWDEVIRYGYYGMYMGSYMPNLGPDVEQLHKGAGETLTAVVRDAAGEASTVAIEERVRQGHPAQVLIDEAGVADLLVVGARGHGSFTDLILGSVSSHCVHHATCTVVVVRPGMENRGNGELT